MTFKAAKLLKRLKQAQMRQDAKIMIDFDCMTAGTGHSLSEDFQEVSLRGYETSLFATLDYLEQKGYIAYDYPSGEAVVKHEGWHATEMTIRQAADFAFRDVIVPILVAVITAFITAKLAG